MRVYISICENSLDVEQVLTSAAMLLRVHAFCILYLMYLVGTPITRSEAWLRAGCKLHSFIRLRSGVMGRWVTRGDEGRPSAMVAWEGSHKYRGTNKMRLHHAVLLFLLGQGSLLVPFLDVSDHYDEHEHCSGTGKTKSDVSEQLTGATCCFTRACAGKTDLQQNTRMPARIATVAPIPKV